MKYIENLIEPDRLMLSWQAIDSSARSRYAVASVTRNNEYVKLQYLTDTEDFRISREHGFEGHPAFRLKESEDFDSHVLEAFSRRLPPRNRGDFAKYLNIRAIPSDAKLSVFGLLGYTGAKLPDDGFELVHPFSSVESDFELVLEVAGFRHHMEETPLAGINIGASVEFVPEPENEIDGQAVMITLNGKKIGYVDRARTNLFHQYRDKGFHIGGEVYRTNGTTERPLIYIFTEFTRGKC